MSRDDAINRERALEPYKDLNDDDVISVRMIKKNINELPSVTQKSGKWISHYDEDAKEGWYECDRCHTERAFNTKYCPDCGCCMVEPQERSKE